MEAKSQRFSRHFHKSYPTAKLFFHSTFVLYSMQIFPIAVKVPFAVVIAAAIYGNQWSGKLVQFKVDKLVVVQVLQATYSQEPHLMHLVQ